MTYLELFKLTKLVLLLTPLLNLLFLSLILSSGSVLTSIVAAFKLLIMGDLAALALTVSIVEYLNELLDILRLPTGLLHLFLFSFIETFSLSSNSVSICV